MEWGRREKKKKPKSTYIYTSDPLPCLYYFISCMVTTCTKTLNMAKPNNSNNVIVVESSSGVKESS